MAEVKIPTEDCAGSAVPPGVRMVNVASVKTAVDGVGIVTIISTPTLKLAKSTAAEPVSVPGPIVPLVLPKVGAVVAMKLLPFPYLNE